jgi:hypothetical protein
MSELDGWLQMNFPVGSLIVHSDDAGIGGDDRLYLRIQMSNKNVNFIVYESEDPNGYRTDEDQAIASFCFSPEFLIKLAKIGSIDLNESIPKQD